MLADDDQHSVTLVHPTDPLASVCGGIDTFVRGLIEWAPERMPVELIGVSTDGSARPVGKWSWITVGNKRCRFHPVLHVDALSVRRRIPLSLRFFAALTFRQPHFEGKSLVFHRYEPALAFLRVPVRKVMFVHLRMGDTIGAKADFRWSKVPGLYRRLENMLVPRMQALYTVSSRAVIEYRARFPDIPVSFAPTWVDSEKFRPPTRYERTRERARLRHKCNWAEGTAVGVMVGRLDSQKDPLLALRSIRYLHKDLRFKLLVIGEGILRERLLRTIVDYNLAERVLVAGELPQSAIAKVYQGADVFLLPSRYEGMPMSLLEAQACGLPVVASDVGEVSRTVRQGWNGVLVGERTPQAFAKAITDLLNKQHSFADRATAGVQEYFAQSIVPRFYKQILEGCGDAR